jgi:hypothetical protein
MRISRNTGKAWRRNNLSIGTKWTVQEKNNIIVLPLEILAWCSLPQSSMAGKSHIR